MKSNSRAFAAACRLIGRSLGWLLLGLAGVGMALRLQSTIFPVVGALVAAWILFAAFTLYFFRDPDPQVPTAPDVVVAPAHGLVDCVEETEELEFMGGVCRRISIFLSIMDVHVQNAPVSGKVIRLKYQPGQFLSALKTESAACNENVFLGIESSEHPGERLVVRPIAGLIARRIVSWVGVGDTVARGQRLGLIQYGSRCDLYLPLVAQVAVQPGDRVVGGDTVIARRAVAPPRPNPAAATPATPALS